MFLQDSSLLGSHHNQTGIRVKLFRRPQHMPQNVKLGDIVLIRGAMLKWMGGNSFLTDYLKDADYLFFSSSEIPDPAFNAPHVSEESRIIKHATLPGKVVAPPIPAEQDYIIKLREWAKRHADALPQPGETPKLVPKPQPPPSAPAGPRVMANTSTIRHQVPPRPGFAGVPTVPGMSYRAQNGKFAHLKDVQCDRFHDLVGEVLKIWDNGHVIDLYISDYTFNPMLFDYKENVPNNDGRDGDPHGYADSIKPKKQWQGPYGKHTICVALFEPHASFARREIRVGDFVKARNARCHVKGGNLQASLHEDRMHPDQVDLSKLSYTHDLYKLVNTAKEAYMESRNAKPKTSGSKQEKKKKRQKDQKAKEKAAAEAAAKDVDEKAEDEEMEADGLFVEDSRDKLNPKSKYPTSCAVQSLILSQSSQPTPTVQQQPSQDGSRRPSAPTATDTSSKTPPSPSSTRNSASESASLISFPQISKILHNPSMTRITTTSHLATTILPFLWTAIRVRPVGMSGPFTCLLRTRDRSRDWKL